MLRSVDAEGRLKVFKTVIWSASCDLVSGPLCVSVCVCVKLVQTSSCSDVIVDLLLT